MVSREIKSKISSKTLLVFLNISTSLQIKFVAFRL